jgi:hypothetical protein
MYYFIRDNLYVVWNSRSNIPVHYKWYRFSVVEVFIYNNLLVEVAGKIKSIGAMLTHSALPLSAS